ncbi:hypothetical protein VJ923_11965 [Adlercreutzia sp. R25]|uniref:hypothetical protein n=1 Tax=Adlercreutzia shanghongiae TaxID=3111773 RepID=UPI002DB7D86A|nr:hypothetical protein [Adlercreutzia sp. R25]MEC4273874.1 hypothetical protein [Adlercreutzia sp. R25]
MNIVFIVDSYLPAPAAVGVCVMNVVEAMKSEHDITVLALASTPGMKDVHSIEGEGYRIVYVKTPESVLRARSIERLRSGTSECSKLLGSIGLLSARFWRQLRLVCSENACDPNLVEAYYKALSGLPEAPNVIVPACMPFESVVAASKYKDQIASTNVVPMLFDQFADSSTIYRLHLEKRVKYRANVDVEREALSRAKSIMQITWSDHIADEFPEFSSKLVRIEHPLLINRRAFVQKKHSRDITMVYAGALDRDIRNPAWVIEVLEKALNTEDLKSIVEFYVPSSQKYLCYFKGKNPRFQIKEAVPYSEISTVLGNASCLLSIGNQTIDQKVSKIYEYMGYGLPILHFAARLDDPAVQDIEKYPLGCLIFKTDSLDSNCDKIRIFLEANSDSEIEYETVCDLFPEESPKMIAQIIEGCA